MDDPLPSAIVGDFTFEENDNSTEFEVNPEDNSVILTQPAVDKPVVPLTSLANPSNAKDPPTQEAQDLPSKGQNPTRPFGLLNLAFFFPSYCKFDLIFEQC